MTIQWFPGHMAKARRQVTEKIKLVDIQWCLINFEKVYDLEITAPPELVSLIKKVSQ